MKTRLLFFSLLLLAQQGFTQKLTQTQKLASLCKVWGFLKYYHPVVAEGKYDWDTELFRMIPLTENAANKEQLNKAYIDWIAGLGDIKGFEDRPETTTATPKNKYLQWINDTGLYNDEFRALVTQVKKKRPAKGGHYIKPHKFTGNANFTNEKDHKDLLYPPKNIRLLALFRYWNMIEYYFPYKYLTDKDWEKVLDDMTLKFSDATDTIAYRRAVAELVADVNDSHASLAGYAFTGYKHWLPSQFKIIDDKAVVNGSYYDSLSLVNDLRYGDVLTAINDTPLTEYIASYERYVGASNYPTFLRSMNRLLSRSQTDSLSVSIDRGGGALRKKVACYPATVYPNTIAKTQPAPVYKMLEGNIGYVDMGVIKPKQVKKCLKELNGTKAIVLDVRNYPKGTMYAFCNKLSKEKKPFVTFTQPDYSCPGAFKYDKPYYCGKANREVYNGKIIVLLNEETQSHAEFTCMAFKTLPNAIFIGSQTAGADGNVSDITLPGGISFYMTGLGIYYPDGTETQRIGIVPDIEVKPTIKGIQEHRDEVLERAMVFINTGK